ncbi:MAG: hypothetical protein KJO98_13100, partial [Rhodothermia bacterium]|nr:hypothetical protein [Rhodothermia bacterium]
MKYRSRLRFFVEGIEGIVVLAVAVCTWPVSKRWLRNCGSRAEERRRNWPGDGLVGSDRETYTRAIDIDAPARVVWRWIVQFGLGRAGFYSYELLERLAGVPVTNVESIELAWQRLAVGDEIKLHPTAPGIPIAELLPERHICFGEHLDTRNAGVGPVPRRSWSIYIQGVSRRRCRLLLRGCIEPLRERTWRKRLASAMEPSLDFVMEQRMLRTVKR